MKLLNPTTLKDTRTDCYSTIFQLTVSDYLQIIEEVYKKRGGIRGQREPLKSSSAMRIRKQMVKDIKAGTILPPIVLGLIVNDEQFENIPHITSQELSKIIEETVEGNLMIIDGMQRTTALGEAIDDGADPNLVVRVEFWISKKLNSLIYRMLILNTGQVPWNLRRQIETVFSSMVNEIKQSVPEMEVFSVDEGNRRVQAGQYHANDLIELYLAFGGRKEKVDTKERLADEFTRLDFIEATENANFADIFYQSLKRLTLLDREFGKYHSDRDMRFRNGKDLFRSQPARVGLITAIARKIYGRPGFDKSSSEINHSKESVLNNLDALIARLREMSNEALENFLHFQLLSEKLSIKSSRVGDFEREFFSKAFDTLLEEGSEIPSLQSCWLSY